MIATTPAFAGAHMQIGKLGSGPIHRACNVGFGLPACMACCLIISPWLMRKEGRQSVRSNISYIGADRATFQARAL